MERGHDAGHHARTDVLEGERRAMKQLERVDVRFDRHERHGKVQRIARELVDRRVGHFF